MNGKEGTTVRKLLHCLLVFSLLFSFLLPVQADGYRVVIEDQEDLLSEAEEAKLKSEMEAINAYGHAAFVSVKQYGATDTYAKETYMSLFGNESGILFVIDMGQRNIWIMCNGEVYRTINKAYANTITDNIYTYASEGDYYRCASEAYAQALTLLQGGKIAQPMKHISNALIALVGALLINFFFLLSQRKKETVDPSAAAAAMTTGVVVRILEKKLTRTRKSRHYESSGGGSSGGGGGGYSGGGGGGGGFSGGGGGHSF